MGSRPATFLVIAALLTIRQALALLAPTATLAAIVQKPVRPGARSQTVVFVCEHGNVKSLIASQWFNRLAEERGLTIRAVSRGLSPEPSVPPPIIERLRADGFDLSRFQPRAIARADLTDAARLVMIGADRPAWVSDESVWLEKWDGIPAASERYEASRDALRGRIAKLIETLADRGAR